MWFVNYMEAHCFESGLGCKFSEAGNLSIVKVKSFYLEVRVCVT